MATKPEDLDGAVWSPLGNLVIPAKHIGLCPFHELTQLEFCKSWSLSRGGSPVPDGVWTITIFRRDESGKIVEDLAQDRWVLPDCFSLMFDSFRKSGDEERARAIRNALKLP